MPAPDPASGGRFQPHAASAMASMFDDVSGRYDLLNRLMTLGQDGAWREAMARRVPERARVVLDLCTGSGVSLARLRRPGRTLLGVDVSLGMLRRASESHAGPGWAPRFACADAFRLPLRDGAVDAVTLAFGVRNLRPRADALAEIARVLAGDGTLVVLEAAAPRRGPLAPLARAWIRHGIPLLGRLSPDPSAYRYLAGSIFEFGSGPEFEAELAAAGFELAGRRTFLLGATRLWVARPSEIAGRNRATAADFVQIASGRAGVFAHGAPPAASAGDGARGWALAQAATTTALAVALAWALAVWDKVRDDLPLSPPQRVMGWTLIVAGLVVFAVRAVILWLRVVAGAGAGNASA